MNRVLEVCGMQAYFNLLYDLRNTYDLKKPEFLYLKILGVIQCINWNEMYSVVSLRIVNH